MKWLTTFLYLLIATTVTAQETKSFNVSQPCGTADKLLTTVQKYGETPLFVGNALQFGLDQTSYRGSAMFFVNQDTGSWSLVSVYQNGIVCMVAVGTNFEPYTNKNAFSGTGNK